MRFVLLALFFLAACRSPRPDEFHVSGTLGDLDTAGPGSCYDTDGDLRAVTAGFTWYLTAPATRVAPPAPMPALVLPEPAPPVVFTEPAERCGEPTAEAEESAWSWTFMWALLAGLAVYGGSLYGAGVWKSAKKAAPAKPAVPYNPCAKPRRKA